MPAAGHASHGASYQGHYANAFVAGEGKDERSVAVMGGFHVDFPYHDPGSSYDQVAVFLKGRKRPILATGRPKLRHLKLKPGEERTRLSHRDDRLVIDLRFESVEHPPLYEGDPADLGDLFIQGGVESEERPGLVYTPYELTRLVRGEIVLRPRRSPPARPRRVIELRHLHGQAEVGTIEAPDDPPFHSAYDYLAAPSLGRRAPYTYVGFEARALHSGPDGALGPYYAVTASDEFTLEEGEFRDANPHGVPDPFDNTITPPPGVRKLGTWEVDLGPGILHRAIVRMSDAAGRKVIGLSETIKEDSGE